jgi:hypothetical protein
MSGNTGNWSDWRNDAREIKGSTLSLAPVFRGEVTYKERNGHLRWWSSLNGQDMGGYPSLVQAKARVDWEIWNSIRQMIPGYKILLARRDEWVNGSH